MGYKTFFGFQKEPFSQEIRVEDLYPLPGLQAASDVPLRPQLGAVLLSPVMWQRQVHSSPIRRR